MSFIGPFHIFVKSLQRSDATTTSDECAPVTFSIPYGGSRFDVWTWQSGQFRNTGNGGVATARNGAVVVCRQPGPQDQTNWRIFANGDGTYHVTTPDAELIWSAGPSGLILTSAQKTITDSEIFAFPQA